VPVACVVVRHEVRADALQGHCRERLAPYEVPRRILFIDAVPKNAVGKPLRRTLRDRINGLD
jgi:acyl-coenzyme A synthetase/AMP-(fatty) acid ligase